LLVFSGISQLVQVSSMSPSVKGEMSEAEMVEAVELDVYPNAAATMTEVGRGWFGRQQAVKAARQAVTAWAMAVNGDQTALAAIADPDRVDWLLHPES
jgi:hypothetical protein